MNGAQPIAVLVCALGGEGGGVLAEWLVDAALRSGHSAQATSIPGVAQRSGATTYYIEVHPLTDAELSRHVRLLQGAWAAFDDAVAGSAAQLRKGPRGGGRDRDAIVEHVREAERSYARSIGVRLPPRTPWAEQRTAIVDTLGSGPATAWPSRYFIRRAAWHVLDHAWEIEDKQP